VLAARARLVELVATALAPLARQLDGVSCCTQLLGVVLDVLGPGFAVEVCQAVYEQLTGQSSPWHSYVWEAMAEGGRQENYLAEALLLGWLRAEGQVAILRRLQRLVPGAGTQSTPASQHRQQQRQQLGHETPPIIEEDDPEWFPDQPFQAQPKHWVWQAVYDAVCERPQQARSWLRHLFEVYPHLQTKVCAPGSVPLLVQLAHEGLMAVAAGQAPKWSWGRNQRTSVAEYNARHTTAAQLHTYLLSSWVAARVPSRELVDAVAAAVASAQQQ